MSKVGALEGMSEIGFAILSFRDSTYGQRREKAESIRVMRRARPTTSASPVRYAPRFYVP